MLVLFLSETPFGTYWNILIRLQVTNFLWSLLIYWKVRKQQQSREVEIENRNKIKAVEEKHAADYAKLKARVQSLEFSASRAERREASSIESQEASRVERQDTPSVESQGAPRVERQEANGTNGGGLHRRQWTSTQE